MRTAFTCAGNIHALYTRGHSRPHDGPVGGPRVTPFRQEEPEEHVG